MSLYFPSLLKPVIRANIILGFMLCKTSGPRPTLSRTPGRKGSIITSAWETSFLMKSCPEGDFRSTAIEDLWRVRRSDAGWGNLENLVCVLLGTARSTRRTEAPLSARRSPAKGPVGHQHKCIICIARDKRPGASPANSITRMPVSGGAPVIMATRSAKWEEMMGKCHMWQQMRANELFVLKRR